MGASSILDYDKTYWAWLERYQRGSQNNDFRTTYCKNVHSQQATGEAEIYSVKTRSHFHCKPQRSIIILRSNTARRKRLYPPKPVPVLVSLSDVKIAN